MMHFTHLSKCKDRQRRMLSASTMLQTITPLPRLPPEAARLMPDMTRADVDRERRTLAQAAVAAIFAAQGLLIALSLIHI